MRFAPAVDSHGTAYAALGNQVVAFAPDTGAEQWRFATGGVILGPAVLGGDGRLRVHSDDGHLYVLDVRGAKAHSPVRIGPPLAWAAPLVDSDGNTWISRADGGLLRVDAHGRVESRPFLRGRRRFDCTGVIRDRVLYLGCEDHFVHAISLAGERGVELWEGGDRGRTGCPINAPLALCGDLLLAVSQDDQLYAFELDGTRRWQVAIPGPALGSPVVAPGSIVLVGLAVGADATHAGALLAIDADTQRTLWCRGVPGAVESSPVVGADDRCYVGDNHGVVRQFRVRDGEELWQESLEASVRSALTLLAPEVLGVGLEDGSLVGLRCESRSLAPGWAKMLGP